MKKILSIIFILLFSIVIPSYAGRIQDAHKKVISRISSVGGSINGQESFDGSSQCMGGETSNCDLLDQFASNTGGDLNSTNGTPEGTYQLELPSSGNNIWWDVSGFEEGANGKYVSFRFEAAAAFDAGNSYILTGYDSYAGTVLFAFQVRGSSDDYWEAVGETNSTGHTTGTVGSGVTYFMVRYKADTGPANAQLEACEWNGSSWDCESTNYDSSLGDLDSVRLYNSESGGSHYFDLLKRSASSIANPTTKE